MQNNAILPRWGASWLNRCATPVKLICLISMLVYILYQLRQQPVPVNTIWQQLQTGVGSVGWLAGLVVLAPVNWGLEARKWQLLIRRVEPTRFRDAFRGVLAGASLGFTLPTLAGDAAGRILSLQSGQRPAAIGASLVSGGLQFLASLFVGTIAWTYQLLTVSSRNTPAGWLLWLLFSLVLLLSMLTAGWRRRLLTGVVTTPVGWRQRLVPYWLIAGEYTGLELKAGFGLALLRHLTFSVQFYLVLRLYGIDLPLGSMLSGIGIVFLVKSSTPAFTFLSDLGVREATALWVFSPYGVSASLLITATFTLWLTNVLTPVLVGLLAVWRLRLTTP